MISNMPEGSIFNVNPVIYTNTLIYQRNGGANYASDKKIFKRNSGKHEDINS